MLLQHLLSRACQPLCTRHSLQALAQALDSSGAMQSAAALGRAGPPGAWPALGSRQHAPRRCKGTLPATAGAAAAAAARGGSSSGGGTSDERAAVPLTLTEVLDRVRQHVRGSRPLDQAKSNTNVSPSQAWSSAANSDLRLHTVAARSTAGTTPTLPSQALAALLPHSRRPQRLARACTWAWT